MTNPKSGAFDAFVLADTLSPLVCTQLVAGAATVLEFIFPIFFWQTGATTSSPPGGMSSSATG